MTQNTLWLSKVLIYYLHFIFNTHILLKLDWKIFSALFTIFTNYIIYFFSGPFGSAPIPPPVVHPPAASVRQSRANSVSSLHKISVDEGPDTGTGTGKLKKNQVTLQKKTGLEKVSTQRYMSPFFCQSLTLEVNGNFFKSLFLV